MGSAIDISDALKFKSDLEASFEIDAGISGRQYYSAVYSLPQHCPVMWLNLNPSGSPDECHFLSDEQFSEGEHEFFEGHGKTSRATGELLKRLFDAPMLQLRSVQGTNLAWERSWKGEDIDLVAAAKRTAPHLQRYIDYVQPQILLFGGVSTFDQFREIHNAQIVDMPHVITGNWGRSIARIFLSCRIQLPILGEYRVIAVAHPSRGIRNPVVEACKPITSKIDLPISIAYS